MTIRNALNLGGGSGIQPLSPDATVATTTNLTASYNNGISGVGATLTLTATGTLTIDGILTALNDDVLVKNQTSTFQNGVYTITTAGAPGIHAVLTRRSDFDNSTNITENSYIAVTYGTVNEGTTWIETAPPPFVVGTSPILFSLFGRGGVTSVTGTSHQVTASPTTGAVILTTPQDIDTTSSPTFAFLAQSVDNNVTATGTSRADAFQLTAAFNNVVSATSGSGVILPTTNVNVGDTVVVFNNTRVVTVFTVYAAGAATINGVAGSTGILMNPQISPYITGDVYGFTLMNSNSWYYHPLGDLSKQNHGDVFFSGGSATNLTISAGTIDNTPIGNTIPNSVTSTSFITTAIVDDISGTYTIDPTIANYFELTVTGDVTISFGATPTPTTGTREETVLIKLLGDGGVVSWVNDGTVNFISGCNPIQDLFNPIYIQFNGHQGIWDGAVVSNYVMPQSVASSSTVNLDAISSNLITISGPSTINAITTTSGIPRQVIFSGAATLVHSSNLKLPNGGSNITTSAGDTAVFLGFKGSSVTTCVSYTRANGTSPAAQVQSDWTEADNTQVDYIKNKPTLGTISSQNANNVAIVGGAIENTPIGQIVPVAGSFSTLISNSIVSSAGSLNNVTIGGSVATTGKFTYMQQAVTDGITAAGTNQSTATVLTAPYNNVTTVASGTGVKLPAALAGYGIVIFNNGANPLKVYANGSETLNGTAGATGVTIATGTEVIFYAFSTSKWVYDTTTIGALGTMAYQDADNVTLSGGTIDGTIIGLINPDVARFLYYFTSTSNTLTATGTDRSTSLSLLSQLNNITTTASGTGVLLPLGVVGFGVEIFNNGANALKVYAHGSETLNGTAGATGISLAAGAWALFDFIDTNTWIYTSSNIGSLGTMASQNIGAVTGVTDGSFGSTGNVGEIIASTVDEGSAVSLTDNTNTDITSITLSAGQWQIKANPTYVTNSSTTVTTPVAWLATASASTTGQTTGNTVYMARATAAAAVHFTGNIVWDISIASTTTYYLVINVDFAGGGAAVTAYGELSALRMR